MRYSFFVLLLTLPHSIVADDRPGNSQRRPIDVGGFQPAQTWRGIATSQQGRSASGGTTRGHSGSAQSRRPAIAVNRSGQKTPPNLLFSHQNRGAQVPGGMSFLIAQGQPGTQAGRQVGRTDTGPLSNQDEQTRQLEQEQERVRQEALRQQQQQRQARQFWGGLYGHRRSSWNQSQSGYSAAGQNRVNQQFGGFSRSGISRSGQSYSNPGFHNQNRFNQSGFVTNLHNVRVATSRGWR